MLLFKRMTSVMGGSAVSVETIAFPERNTFSNKINLIKTFKDAQPFKLLKTVFTPESDLVQIWCYLRQMPGLPLSPAVGTCSPMKGDGKWQRASPSEGRMSGDSSSCLILEPDRFKGECS